MDKLIHGTAAEGTVRVLSAVTTMIVTEAVRRHQPSPTASAALGRVLTGCLLLGSTLKDFDRLTVRLECEGPVGGITAEADNRGHVRGYMKNPEATALPRPDGKFDVGAIIGGGTFYVVREAGFDIGLHRDPYVGSVPIVSGEIAEDFAHYLANSEQIPSAVMLGVLLRNTEPFVVAAGGIMVQMMPGASDDVIEMIERSVTRAPHVTSAVSDGASPHDLARLILGKMNFELLEERAVSFKCTCSIERARAMISSLRQDEIESMLRDDGGAVMSCGFCSEVYQLDDTDLGEILATEAVG
ncbi:MAG: Hsp33 family molecular chaperone HslO [Pyrinomonadaceae bacterium]